MIIRRIFSWSNLMLLSIIFTASCTDAFEGYNTNKHEVDSVTMTYDDLLIGSFFTQMQKNVVMYDEKAGDNGNITSDYQVAQGLTSDVFSGYFAPTLGNGSMNNGAYYFLTNWIEQSFTKPMAKIMGPWKSINKEAEKQQRPQIAALATIVKVEGMHRVADAYGPIPYVNFDGSLKNNYDALDKVYEKFFIELDEAIDVLTEYIYANPSATVLPNYDLIYGGDPTKWVKFANTLRLRLAMRIVYANSTLARSEAEKAVNHPIGLISLVSEKASLKHSSNLVYYHPLYEILRIFAVNADNNYEYGDAQPGATLDAYMNGYKDPRLKSYLTAATLDGGYHGVRSGIPTTTWTNYRDHRYISSINMDASNTEIIWMTAAESFFLRAEGALRGWNMGGDARSFYESGILISFGENNASGVDNYKADATSKPIAFTDNAVGSSYNASAPSTITIAWNEASTFEENLERIITQKWIAIFPDGPEGWAEFRRTGYPKVIPVVTNNSGGTINTQTQVRRIPYPQSEYRNNAEGVASGISKLGGPDNGGIKLWWDKK